MKTKIEITTKSYVGSLHKNSKNRRGLSIVFNDQVNEFDDNELTNLLRVAVKRSPKSDNELTKKKYVDDSRGEGHIVRFYQTLENYLKVSVRNDAYKLTKIDKIQITETTVIELVTVIQIFSSVGKLLAMIELELEN